MEIMRAIQLITIVGIAAVSKGAESASLRQQQYDEDTTPNIFGKSRKRNTSNNNNETSTAPTPLPHPFNMTTCTPTQTPCHDENRDVLSCADPGETCPCYFNELQCHSDTYGDYCDTTCCEWGIEERCHGRDNDDPSVWDVWCAKIDEGGCPCPDGEQKCGEILFKDEYDFRNQRRSYSPYHIEGHCAKVCCRDDEATCYDENYEPHSCVLIKDGGCSCPEGQVRCHGTKDWEGTCEEICCEAEGEMDCYDNAGTKFCSRGGICPEGTMGYNYWESRLVSTIIQKGTRSQVSYYSKIVNRKKDAETTSDMDVIKHLKAEELSLFHTISTISSNERNKAVKKEEEEITVSIS